MSAWSVEPDPKPNISRFARSRLSVVRHYELERSTVAFASFVYNAGLIRVYQRFRVAQHLRGLFIVNFLNIGNEVVRPNNLLNLISCRCEMKVRACVATRQIARYWGRDFLFRNNGRISSFKKNTFFERRGSINFRTNVYAILALTRGKAAL